MAEIQDEKERKELYRLLLNDPATRNNTLKYSFKQWESKMLGDEENFARVADYAVKKSWALDKEDFLYKYAPEKAAPAPKVQAPPTPKPQAAPVAPAPIEQEPYVPEPQPAIGSPEYDAQLQAQYQGMTPTLGATFGGVPAAFETKAQKKQEQISPAFKAQKLAFEDVPIAEEQRRAQRQFAKSMKEQQQIEQKQPKGFFEDLGTQLKRGLAQGEAIQSVNMEQLRDAARGKNLEAIPYEQIAAANKAVKEFGQTQSDIDLAKKEGIIKDAWDVVKALPGVTIESLASLGRSGLEEALVGAGTGAAAGSVIPGLGTAAGGGLGAAAGMVQAGRNMEYFGTLMQELEAKGVDITDPAKLKYGIATYGKDADKTAITRANTIAAVESLLPIAGKGAEALAARVGSKVAQKPLQTVGKALTYEPIAGPLGGATGELAAQIASGQEIDPQAIALEAGGEGAATVAAITKAIKSRKKPSAQPDIAPEAEVVPAEEVQGPGFQIAYAKTREEIPQEYRGTIAEVERPTTRLGRFGPMERLFAYRVPTETIDITAPETVTEEDIAEEIPFEEVPTVTEEAPVAEEAIPVTPEMEQDYSFLEEMELTPEERAALLAQEETAPVTPAEQAAPVAPEAAPEEVVSAAPVEEAAPEAPAAPAPKGRVEVVFPTAFEATEVKPYAEVEDNYYRPDQQLKFNQGTYEPVRIIAHPDVIRAMSIGSKLRDNNKRKTVTEQEIDFANGIAKQLGFTTESGKGNAIMLHNAARELAKQNRSNTEERFVVIGQEQGGKKKAAPALAKTNEEQIAELRQQEQAELDTRIKNANRYRGEDGKVDRSKLKSKADIKAFDEVYAKYDKLISPLIGKQLAAPVTPAPAAPEEGDAIQIAPQREGGSPRNMVFKDGEWKQNVGGDILKVGPAVQQQAQEAFAGKEETKPAETKFKPNPNASYYISKGADEVYYTLREIGGDDLDVHVMNLSKDLEESKKKAKELIGEDVEFDETSLGRDYNKIRADKTGKGRQLAKRLEGEGVAATLSFGKHYGKTIDEVFEIDPSYILYLNREYPTNTVFQKGVRDNPKIKEFIEQSFAEKEQQRKNLESLTEIGGVKFDDKGVAKAVPIKGKIKYINNRMGPQGMYKVYILDTEYGVPVEVSGDIGKYADGKLEQGAELSFTANVQKVGDKFKVIGRKSEYTKPAETKEGKKAEAKEDVYIENIPNIIYRGGEPFDAKKVKSDGVSFSKNKEIGIYWAGSRKSGKLQSFTISLSANILTDIPSNLIPKERATDQDKIRIVNYAKVKGFDGVDLSGIFKEDEIRIFNPNVIIEITPQLISEAAPSFTSEQSSEAATAFDKAKTSKGFDKKYGKGAYKALSDITKNFEDIMDKVSEKIKQDCIV